MCRCMWMCLLEQERENLREGGFSLITFHNISSGISFVRQKRNFDKYEVELECQSDFKNLCLTPFNF